MTHAPTVLIVDDHADALEMLRTYLTAHGCRVLTASTGGEALRLAAAQRPSVILLDVNMPRTTGIDVVRRLREPGFLPDAHIVAMTGVTRQEDRDQALASGFDRVVTKPCDVAALRAIVREVGARADSREPFEF